ncbi:MAG: hypothetical protein HPY52_10590 [Firmicutes bacterium]|nr:hypothetical protein [Bacillota bacterium]
MAMPEEKALARKPQGVTQWDPFVAMDSLDDEAIIAELQGQTVKALVYEFKQDSQIVCGLSKAGVDAVVREMAKQGEVLRELELNVLETPDEFVAHVKAGRFAIQTNQQTGETKETLLDVVFGVKRQPKRHPGGAVNKFAYEQAVSKAARNAKMRLLREDLKQAIITMAKQEGRYTKVTPNMNIPDIHSSKPANSERKPTEAQLKRLYAISKEARADADSMKKLMYDMFGKESSKDLTIDEYNELCDMLLEAKKNEEKEVTEDQTVAAE